MFKTEYLLSNLPFNLLPTIITISFLIIIVDFFICFFSYPASAMQKDKNISYPQTKFAVITDTHVFKIIDNKDSPLYQKYGIEEKNF